MKILPTVGRVVWFRAPEEFQIRRAGDDEPFAAIIAHVETESQVNLTVFDHFGHPHPVVNVHLVQDGEDIPESGTYCQWMPYQISVARGEIPPVLHAQPEKPAVA